MPARERWGAMLLRLERGARGVTALRRAAFRMRPAEDRPQAPTHEPMRRENACGHDIHRLLQTLWITLLKNAFYPHKKCPFRKSYRAATADSQLHPHNWWCCGYLVDTTFCVVTVDTFAERVLISFLAGNQITTTDARDEGGFRPRVATYCPEEEQR
jgi:hypothetical protein